MPPRRHGHGRRALRSTAAQGCGDPQGVPSDGGGAGANESIFVLWRCLLLFGLRIKVHRVDSHGDHLGLRRRRGRRRRRLRCHLQDGHLALHSMQAFLRLSQLLLECLLPRPVRLLDRGADRLHAGAGLGLGAPGFGLTTTGQESRAFLQQHRQLSHDVLPLRRRATEARQLRLGPCIPLRASLVLVLFLPPTVHKEVLTSPLEQPLQSMGAGILDRSAPAQARHRGLQPLHHSILHFLKVLFDNLVHQLRPDGPWGGQEAVHHVVGYKITNGVEKLRRHHRVPLGLGRQQGQIPLVLLGQLAQHREHPVVRGVGLGPIAHQPDHVVMLLGSQLAEIPLSTGQIQL
mmetsp:Transcript_56071/g.122853  ORF Transcript_56071/g.122853 Transcript_56071/m.122853 type:complete len:346 (-) Transcript_56071:456-1493(-)